MASTPACWAAFGVVLAREYSAPEYFDVHRLTVDAYAVQHPGEPSRQSIQSVGLHLVRLCLLLERNLPASRANDAMLVAVKHKDVMTWLEPPASRGEVTVADVLTAADVESHKRAVAAWARSAWNAWHTHHETVRAWAGPA